MDKLMRNPMGLSDAEMPMYNMFLETEKRPPSCMWELMHYSAGMQQRSAQERKFWGGVFGL